MSGFTCISCRVAFADADIQRLHYKTDWHRYNLKRKVAELPPVTAENFQERVLAQRAEVAEKEKDQSGYCELCQKRFSTRNATENHLQSKKHKEAVAKQPEKDTKNKNKKNEHENKQNVDAMEKDARNLAIKEKAASSSSEPGAGCSSSTTTQDKDGDNDMASDEEEWDADSMGIEECLFCSFISQSLEANVDHMAKSHGFFIPDLDFLSDLEGFISYLGEKIGQGKICLWCNEKSKTFLDTKSVQKHMVDKGHCKLEFAGDAMYEYSDHYDYRSSYPDRGNAAGSEEDDAVMEHDGGASDDDGDNFTLVLPSGATVGHRSLMRYYRQNLRPDRQVVLRKPGAVTRMMAQYKALGWTGCTGTAAQKKAKDQAFLRRHRQKFRMQLGVKANKFQPHLRPQVIF